MEIQVEELLQRIKRDGVEAAQKSSEEIISQAEAQAEGIIKAAQKKADQILNKNERTIKQMQESSNELLRQSARDLLLQVRQNLIALFDRYLITNYKSALSVQEFAQIIVAAISHTLTHTPPQSTNNAQDQLHIEIAPKDKEKILKEIQAKITEDALAGKVSLIPSAALNSGFYIAHGTAQGNQGIKYDFSTEAIWKVISELLHPSIRNLLRPTKDEESHATKQREDT